MKDSNKLRNIRDRYGNSLLRAEQFLKEGVRFDQNRAIIHYHLARVYLTYVEMIWQENAQNILLPNVGGQASEIDIYINDAFRHWRSAKDQDTFDRLHKELTWIHSRISSYKVAWESRKYRGIAGEVKLEMEAFKLSNDDK
jgi:hypothetical protein